MRARVVVSGAVQGVGFRWTASRQAREHGVAGWIRNNDDGTVEAVFEGVPAAVDHMIAWCRKGPRSASVAGVGVQWEPPEGLTAFE